MDREFPVASLQEEVVSIVILGDGQGEHHLPTSVALEPKGFRFTWQIQLHGTMTGYDLWIGSQRQHWDNNIIGPAEITIYVDFGPPKGGA